MPKTVEELYRAIQHILPETDIQQDDYGQIIIYTEKTEDSEGNLKEIE